jgi:hypothetical protein
VGSQRRFSEKDVQSGAAGRKNHGGFGAFDRFRRGLGPWSGPVSAILLSKNKKI